MSKSSIWTLVDKFYHKKPNSLVVHGSCLYRQLISKKEQLNIEHICIAPIFYNLLHLFQIINRFRFCRYISLTMYEDIEYIKVHSKTYVFKKVKTFYNSELGN